jgi:four helix bundle protein
MPIWQKGVELLLKIYKITKEYPSDEKFGLVSDMRRCVNSIVHNIAEGFGRYESKDKTRFYKISRGSCFELISQLLVSSKLKYIKDETLVNKIIIEIKSIIKNLNSLIKTDRVLTLGLALA